MSRTDIRDEMRAMAKARRALRKPKRSGLNFSKFRATYCGKATTGRWRIISDVLLALDGKGTRYVLAETLEFNGPHKPHDFQVWPIADLMACRIPE